MTLFSHKNALGAQVRDADARKVIQKVSLVDTTAGVVYAQVEEPPLLDHEGNLRMEEHRFEFIHPIFAGKVCPVLFLCYGRKA